MWRERGRQESVRKLRVRCDGRDHTLPGRRLLDCKKSGSSHTARLESSIRVVARKTIGHPTLPRGAADGLKPWKRNGIVTRRTDPAQTVRLQWRGQPVLMLLVYDANVVIPELYCKSSSPTLRRLLNANDLSMACNPYRPAGKRNREMHSNLRI